MGSTIEAISRVADCCHESDDSYKSSEKVDTFLIKTVTANHFIAVHDIVFMLSNDSYTYLTLVNQQVIKSSRNIGYYEKQLCGNSEFIRIHSKCLVNINFVQGYSNKTERDVILIEPFPRLKSSREGLKKMIDILDQFHF